MGRHCREAFALKNDPTRRLHVFKCRLACTRDASHRFQCTQTYKHLQARRHACTYTIQCPQLLSWISNTGVFFRSIEMEGGKCRLLWMYEAERLWNFTNLTEMHDGKDSFAIVERRHVWLKQNTTANVLLWHIFSNWKAGKPISFPSVTLYRHETRMRRH